MLRPLIPLNNQSNITHVNIFAAFFRKATAYFNMLNKFVNCKIVYHCHNF